jgi:hypothetical protein
VAEKRRGFPAAKLSDTAVGLAPALATADADGAPSARAILEPVLASRTTDLEIGEVPGSGHCISEEQPKAIVGHFGHFIRFFRGRPGDATLGGAGAR